LLALAEKAYFAIELAEHPVGLQFKLTRTLIECVATETAHKQYLPIWGITVAWRRFTHRKQNRTLERSRDSNSSSDQQVILRLAHRSNYLREVTQN
jgi:hypothetical protein